MCSNELNAGSSRGSPERPLASLLKQTAEGFTVLLVEDDANDTLFFRLAAAKAGLFASVHSVCDGKAATAYLQGLPPYEDRIRNPMPNFLVLDLKMPCMDGFELLKWVRERPCCSHIVIGVLSGSNWKQDIDRAIALGADWYLSKPLSFEELCLTVERMKQRWLAHPLRAPPQGAQPGQRPVL